MRFHKTTLKNNKFHRNHRICKFPKISIQSEKHKARAGDFTEFARISKVHQVHEISKCHKVSPKFEKHTAGAYDFTEIIKIHKFNRDSQNS